MTDVLVINGSARTTKGNTAFVLSPFIQGMKKAGANVELLYSKKMDIRPCLGCFDCWGKTIGRCTINDEMQDLYPKLKATDILVLATPIYIPLPGMMQNLINRLCPLIEPLLEFKDGRTRAHFHNDVKISKILTVLTGGWWEIENLNIPLKVMEELALNSSCEFAGAILRPHAYVLKEENELNHHVLSKLEEVGQQLINNGQIDPKDLDFISQPLVDKDTYLDMLNQDYLDAKANLLNHNIFQ
jgi:multimeric flavodoxin WrbA